MKLIEATVTKQLCYIFVQKTLLTLNFFTHTNLFCLLEHQSVDKAVVIQTVLLPKKTINLTAIIQVEL